MAKRNVKIFTRINLFPSERIAALQGDINQWVDNMSNDRQDLVIESCSISRWGLSLTAMVVYEFGPRDQPSAVSPS